MSKAAQRRRQAAAARPLWLVDVVYADGTGELNAFATRREAERMAAIVELVKLKEPQGIKSIEVFCQGGHRG